ncbi:MAG: transposase [Magnetococcales bacterium]|nr:transposase [Magnetococcales bacterium]
MKSLLKEGVACSDGKTAGTCRQLLKRFPALWTFLRVPGVEPTNNAAERALRKGGAVAQRQLRHRQRGGKPVRGAHHDGGRHVSSTEAERSGLPGLGADGKPWRA